MAILSDRDIVRRRAMGELEITPFVDEHLTSNGYDLSVGEVSLGGVLHREGAIVLPPSAWFAVATRERLKLGRRLSGALWLRSTWVRRGIIASFGVVDAGFQGGLTLPAFNASSGGINLSIGDTFVQLVFQELSSEADRTYAERGGKYQGQGGITLA